MTKFEEEGKNKQINKTKKDKGNVCLRLLEIE